MTKYFNWAKKLLSKNSSTKNHEDSSLLQYAGFLYKSNLQYKVRDN